MPLHRSPFGACGEGLQPLQIANFVVLGVLTAIYVPLTALRLYTRKRIVKSSWYDDWTMVGAVTLLLPYTGLSWYTAYLGLGTHLGCYPTANAYTILKCSLAMEMFVVLSLGLSRASIGLLLIRLFGVSKKTRVWLYSLITFQALIMAITAALVVPRCQPVQKLWKPSMPGTCWSKHVTSSVLYLNGGTKNTIPAPLAAADA